MTLDETDLPGVLIVKPAVHRDDRGHFLESWNKRDFASAEINASFVQDNVSESSFLTLRGLHYQLEQPQAKLVQAVSGRIFDVAVDLRRSSATFGRWVGVELSCDNRRSLWIPAGFAHGFIALSGAATVHYKCSDYYLPEDEHVIRWDDPDIGIEWPIPEGENPQLSDRDRNAGSFKTTQTFP